MTSGNQDSLRPFRKPFLLTLQSRRRLVGTESETPTRLMTDLFSLNRYFFFVTDSPSFNNDGSVYKVSSSTSFLLPERLVQSRESSRGKQTDEGHRLYTQRQRENN